VTAEGTLELSLATVTVADPGPDEVVVRVEASPINPSDLGLLIGAADMATAQASGSTDSPVVTAKIPARLMKSMAGRVGDPMPVGNEGAGVVVDTGSSEASRALLGKTVAVVGGAMYSQYRCLSTSQCLELPDGTLPSEGASCFVNPLTALSMVETMRLENHAALVNTAAASNLGQMLNKLCVQDDVRLVNIVRKPEQERILRAIGATWVCNSSSAAFMNELSEALVATSATLAFDAIGGGGLAGQILTCMEAAAVATTAAYSRYGSSTYKQVYIYGNLDPGPTELNRNFGFSWGIGGWLLSPFLQKIGPEAVQRMRERVAAGVKATFASSYARTISLAQALQLDAISGYRNQATGEKYLINPNG